MSEILNVINLSKKYGFFTAVKNVNFVVSSRECVALLGENGAGKTTTMKMIYSAASITDGQIKVDGIDVSKNPATTKRALGIVSQEDLLDGSLTVLENLIAHGICYDIPKKQLKEKCKELLEFVGLSNYANKEITSLSGGMRRRLVLARAMLNDPKLIILDEPTTGLDVQSRHVIWKKLLTLKQQGVALLLTSHYMDEVEKLADKVLIIHQGVVLAEGTPDNLPVQNGYKTLEDTFLGLTGFDEEANDIVQALS
ncbi:ABC transporter ATP-binding protein [Pediococcus cellicola]|uniref:ABC transporter ATP-binding protein n=1 Tax=Pediococcus cellicola TaxID=319652 RepID=A0A0R2IPD5_9LACO|nr:ABC transporter ATP-binding protein [Pediococcus cellicola]KRN67043.1 ABC transporter ATP-binding protein [Pediococcus cellicola]GEL15022.1 hypothetical protein PCE01_08240 [Pediococcus cellicola]